jgi:hypothetical protein
LREFDGGLPRRTAPVLRARQPLVERDNCPGRIGMDAPERLPRHRVAGSAPGAERDGRASRGGRGASWTRAIFLRQNLACQEVFPKKESGAPSVPTSHNPSGRRPPGPGPDPPGDRRDLLFRLSRAAPLDPAAGHSSAKTDSSLIDHSSRSSRVSLTRSALRVAGPKSRRTASTPSRNSAIPPHR